MISRTRNLLFLVRSFFTKPNFRFQTHPLFLHITMIYLYQTFKVNEPQHTTTPPSHSIEPTPVPAPTSDPPIQLQTPLPTPPLLHRTLRPTKQSTTLRYIHIEATLPSHPLNPSSSSHNVLSSLVNGTAAGWGNVGGGATQLLMPLLYEIIKKCGATSFVARQISFFIPGIVHIVKGILLLTLGQDLPHGNLGYLQKKGNVQQLLQGLGCSYFSMDTPLGVELTTDNVIAEYFYDRFDLKLHTAGIITAEFRDGKLGVAPVWGSGIRLERRIFRDEGKAVDTLDPTDARGCLLHMARPVKHPAHGHCGPRPLLGGGFVPFVSRRPLGSSPGSQALGIISGVTGAGGNIGTGLTYMGIMIIACTLPWGSMFFPPSRHATEEIYYGSEYNEDEKKGMHQGSMKFAESSKSERGRTGGPTPDAMPGHA
ncbi:hypothetical protein V2J09_008969 [Rumex salicifolius]